MSTKGYANWKPRGSSEDGDSSDDEENAFESDDEDPSAGIVNQADDTEESDAEGDIVEEGKIIPTGDEFEDTMSVLASRSELSAPASAERTPMTEAQRYLEARRKWSDQGVATNGVALDRNFIKEKMREGQREIGLVAHPRTMKLYPTLPPPPGSFTAALLDVIGSEANGSDTLQTGLGRGRFSQLFSAHRFRTDPQDCSIYTIEKSGARTRMIVDNETIDTNVYFPQPSGSLAAGEHLSVLEYDLRALAAESTDEDAANYYGLFKSSFLHKPAGPESRSHLESVPILLSFGRLPEVVIKPQIAGDYEGSAGTRQQMEDRVWYSVGSGGGEAAFTRKEPLVIFRFGSGATPQEQRLLFVYLVMSQGDATVGLASLMDHIYLKGGPALAAAGTALHAISQLPIQNDEHRVEVARAAHHMARLFTTKVTPEQGVREVGHLHVIPVRSETAAPAEVERFKRIFQAFYTALGRAKTEAEAHAVFFAGQADNERDRFDAFHSKNFNGSATFLSQMTYAMQHRVTPVDTIPRISDLWQFGSEALEQFAPSPALLEKVSGSISKETKAKIAMPRSAMKSTVPSLGGYRKGTH